MVFWKTKNGLLENEKRSFGISFVVIIELYKQIMENEKWPVGTFICSYN